MYKYFMVIFCFCLSLTCRGQFDLPQPVRESGYGLLKTNVTFRYDHAFGALPDNLTGKITYQVVDKPYLKFSINSIFNNLWANFDNSQLAGNRDAWKINLNGNHTLGSFGFTALGFVPVNKKPLALLLIGNVEWSTHCFGRFSGLAGVAYILKMSERTQFGVGPMVMLHTSSSFPILPGVIYKHSFNDKFAINIYGGIFGLEYNPSENDLIAIGSNIDVRSFYFKPHVAEWPKRCRFTMTMFQPLLKYKHRFYGNFYGEAQCGVSFKIGSQVTGASSTHNYMKVKEGPAFFIKAGVSYSL